MPQKVALKATFFFFPSLSSYLAALDCLETMINEAP